MANESTHPFAQSNHGRSARFVRSSEETTERQASWRPPEDIAQRRDVLEAFRMSSGQDAASIFDDRATQSLLGFGAALADEALGHADRAHILLQRYGAPDPSASAAIQARIALLDSNTHAHHAALEDLFSVSEGTFRALVGIQLALNAWREGDAGATVLAKIESATANVEQVGGFAAAAAMRLAVDTLLETGHAEQALASLEASVDHPRVSRSEKASIAALYAVWASVFGHREKAVDVLLRQGQKGLLHSDVERTLLHLLYELDRRTDAFEVLTRSTLARESPELAAALTAHVQQHDGPAAWDTLKRALRDFPEDDALVEFGVQALIELDVFGDELIDVLNRRLETPLDTARRVWTLCHLGRLYEDRPDMESAAAEVYREALAISPGNGTAIRALGRLFSRLGEWEALGALFEQEIAMEKGTLGVWRRHFQAAEVFEQKVGDDKRAIKHYRKVLALRPGFLPALKGAARILENHQQWGPLADMFLASVSAASNRRQKLYLLDKVAEVAEVHLGNLDVAIGAWEEVLHLEPEHPTAFAALGRLYARAERWPELVHLNERELALIDEPEEAAAMWVRNAEIATKQLNDSALAERSLREALLLLPDYLPALESLGRILVRENRLGELIAMTDRQIAVNEDANENWRRLGAVAELVEARVGQEDEAIALYERMLGQRPNDQHVAETLAILYRRARKWRELCALYSKVAEHADSAVRAQLHAEIGLVLEWKLENGAAAFEHYVLSLEESPEQAHTLEGILRTWTVSGVDPAVLADDLEDVASRTKHTAHRQAYMMAIATLRERADRNPLRSAAFRAHAGEHFENQAVLRLAHAMGGERAALATMKRQDPMTAQELIQYAALTTPDSDVLRAIIETLPELHTHERKWLFSALPTAHLRGFVDETDGAWDRLRAEFGRVLEGDVAADEPKSAAEWRLRAIEARLAGDMDAAIDFTEGELTVLRHRDIAVLRFVELARATTDASWLARATDTAFPPEDQSVADGPVFERLRFALEEAAQWDRLRFALEVHVENPAMSDVRRAEVFEQLGELLEKRFSDHQAAAHAYRQSVALVESRAVRGSLVRMFEALNDFESACDDQRHHFDLTLNNDATIEERHTSGLKLADLLVQVERGDEAVRLLEGLLHPLVEIPSYRTVQRRLAHLHADHGDLARASELLEALIAGKPSLDDIGDWRRLVRLRREDFGDVVAAYSLQWKLVKAMPGSLDDLEELFELALELGELGECCGLMVTFARELKDENIRWRLLGRTAEAFDEDLHWSDDAVKLYRELVEVTEGTEQLHFRRRLSFCLSRSAGREAEAIKHFAALAQAEPFEVTNYQALSELYERVQAYDRARLTRQVLRALRVPMVTDDVRIKTAPSRPFDATDVHKLLVPEAFGDGVWDVLVASMPLAEKVWADALPQKKALDGEKVKDPRVLQILENAFGMFGLKRWRAIASDSGPVVPFVFDDGTVWFNADVLANAPEAQLRFLAGFAAALAWSGLGSLVALDGRHVWHLVEGVQLRQTGKGFSERVDVTSQDYAEQIGGAFETVARRRVHAALEAAAPLQDAHCEAWPLELQRFACRVGLVACGEVEAALGAILRIDGWVEPLTEDASQRRLQRSREAEELVKFAFSDAYLQARYRLGLTGRPTQV